MNAREAPLAISLMDWSGLCRPSRPLIRAIEMSKGRKGKAIFNSVIQGFQSPWFEPRIYGRVNKDEENLLSFPETKQAPMAHIRSRSQTCLISPAIPDLRE
jgi:hypothetical protein